MVVGGVPERVKMKVVEWFIEGASTLSLTTENSKGEVAPLTNMLTFRGLTGADRPNPYES